MTIPFVFSSANLPKLKAKQLSKAFPFLKLSAAQEATARAMGYSSWYECTHRGTQGEPSQSDQEAGMPVRVARYYHQAGVLHGLGITPIEADRWVRAWGLTGSPTLAPEHGLSTYYEWNDALERFEAQKIDEARLLEECGDGGYSKYPDIDRPERICPGVILGPMGKYPHYAVDPAVNARIPIYLRGPYSTYHLEDDGDVLEMCVPGFPKSAESERSLHRLSAIQHEWHFSQKHPEASDLYVPRLIADALARPDEMVVISVRAMPSPGGSYDFTRYAVACLRGKDFATFLQDKGVLDSTAVVWYCDVEESLDYWELNSLLLGHELDTGSSSLPVFKSATKYQPCLPVYSYPFMTAPMSPDEYAAGSMERSCLLPLNEDYDAEGDEDDWDDEDGPGDPDNTSLTPLLSDVQPE
jgi:hypothetical protein